VSAFAIADRHPHHALHAVAQDRHATALIDRPVSVTFAGGTVIDALNASADVAWRAFRQPRTP
jgi:hypothetical protein